MVKHLPFAGLWSALLLCILRSAAAAETHAGLGEPPILPQVSGQESLRARVADYRAAFEQKSPETLPEAMPGAFIRDPATYHKRHDILWSIEQALDEKRAIDLTEFGFNRTASGSYSIKTREAPQWNPFDSFLEVLSTPESYEGHARALRQRGFRDQDLESMRSYLGANRPERVWFFPNKLLTQKFASTVVERRKRGSPIGREEVQAYRYHANWNINEARRRWAVGLLDTLDKQRQRILISYFQELGIVYSIAVSNAGKSDLDVETQQTLDYLASGRYIQDLERQEVALQKETR